LEIGDISSGGFNDEIMTRSKGYQRFMLTKKRFRWIATERCDPFV